MMAQIKPRPVLLKVLPFLHHSKDHQIQKQPLPFPKPDLRLVSPEFPDLSSRLLAHWRIFLSVTLDFGLAGAALRLGDRVHDHWYVGATSPPGALLCEGYCQRCDAGRGKVGGVRQVPQTACLHMICDLR